MSTIILDYADVLTETHSLTYGGVDPSRFYRQMGWCPQCKEKAPLIHEDSHEDVDYEDSASSRYYKVTIFQCKCGWWDIGYDHWTGHDSVDGIYEWLDLLHGILRRFDLSDVQLPVDVLRRELEHHPNAIDHIHHKKMEELVASVMSDFYPGCEVNLCGKSHDGGIDLVLVQCDTPIALQVKHRQRVHRGEPVSAIREFLGAMQLAGLSHGIYVTTADKFSQESVRAAENVITLDKIRRFDLIDRNRFFTLLNLVAEHTTEAWRKHLPHPFG